ncbi:hypothetical protein I79_004756 [Cricetulus griseus]|uniref:Uncharacterized protein n=1 Tax=Cricetulus griseus TaxID=10029 RepID=G3H3E1_CRIGR|nr:hypothetical protein I79_004756 [Cricetulus griseus]
MLWSPGGFSPCLLWVPFPVPPSRWINGGRQQAFDFDPTKVPLTSPCPVFSLVQCPVWVQKLTDLTGPPSLTQP